ncbi:hypothetical protein BGZ96_004311, partial [Linnemannia gamsii]
LRVDNDPVDYNQVMLTVGTYGTYSTITSEGYLTVFDKNGQGRIQTADGNLLAAPSNEISAVGLGIPTPVNMNGMVPTENAIPITMGNTAYILNKILTYSSNGAVASFNIFDLATNTWSGDNLISAPVIDPNSTSSTFVGATIGGVVGGLLVIALVVFFIIRRRRRECAQKKSDVPELAKLNSDENKNTGDFGPGYVQYDPVYVQYDQGYVPYDQGYVQYDQQQQHGYQPSPTFFPPPPTPVVNQDSDESYKVDATDGATNNPYVSPTPYRDSISHPAPESPESVFATSVKSSVIQGPQYVPSTTTTAASDSRSPQAVTR